jgi:hypothetical protein
MKMRHATKTKRGWELADDSGTFEAEADSEVFPDHASAHLAALKEFWAKDGWDECKALERRFD